MYYRVFATEQTFVQDAPFLTEPYFWQRSSPLRLASPFRRERSGRHPKSVTMQHFKRHKKRVSRWRCCARLLGPKPDAPATDALSHGPGPSIWRGRAVGLPPKTRRAHMFSNTSSVAPAVSTSAAFRSITDGMDRHSTRSTRCSILWPMRVMPQISSSLSMPRRGIGPRRLVHIIQEPPFIPTGIVPASTRSGHRFRIIPCRPILADVLTCAAHHRTDVTMRTRFLSFRTVLSVVRRGRWCHLMLAAVWP